MDGCDGLAVRGLPPLDPSTALRVSGPATGDGFRGSGEGWENHPHPNPLPPTGEGTGHGPATGDGFRLSPAGMTEAFR